MPPGVDMHSQRGFTLMELLITLVIIAILAFAISC
jgi:prepilin-type N-terminal cleavage/methylation domain-containing protein